MAELKILSFNTQGLGGIKKQKDVFHFLKNKEFDIYCLQDTHFIASEERYIRNRWEGNCYFSPAPQANARGVAIFFAKNLDYKIHSQKHQDQDQDSYWWNAETTITHQDLWLGN